MGKQNHELVTACVFLFMVLTSRSSCTSPREFRSKSGIGSSSDQQKLKENDLIKKLPGQPSVGFKQYSGYIPVDESNTRFLFYYFVEATKANDSTPLVLWFNGGPGCTSLMGAFQENGPFRIYSDGKTLYKNPYSWNNEANMLYIEAPALVGFSYTDIPSDMGDGGDKMTAEDNYIFLVNWLERFTEYKGRELYITGQSYAGHYVPQLAQRILHRNNKTFINLKGILIGNPGLDKMAEMKGDNEFLMNHAIISREMFDKHRELCSITNGSVRTGCSDAMLNIAEIRDSIDVYNIYAPMCLNSNLTSKPIKHVKTLKFDPCNMHYLKAYLNNANVQEAIHVKTTAWTECNDRFIKWNDEDKKASMLPILHELMGAGIRVFVYSGDLDAAVSITSTKYVLQNMNLTTEKTWRPWFSGREVGGYIEEYKGNFTYATVRGAGHSVPQDQPIRALIIFTNFIRNTPLPHM